MTPETLAALILTVRRRGGTIFLAGCGGFHAHAQHVAAELVVRYKKDREPIRAIALGCNPAITTAAVNDLGPREMLAREFVALADEHDLLITYSTSGMSPMLLAVAFYAREMSVELIERVEDQEAALHFDHQMCAALEAML